MTAVGNDGSGYDGRMNGGSLPLALAAHEVEVAAFVGLQDRLVEEMRVATRRPFGRGLRPQRSAALVELGIIDQQIDAALFDVEPDHVAVLHQRQRAADRGLRRDVQHDRSEEHTSELQSHLNLVCRLLLEKKKKKKYKLIHYIKKKQKKIKNKL